MTCYSVLLCRHHEAVELLEVHREECLEVRLVEHPDVVLEVLVLHVVLSEDMVGEVHRPEVSSFLDATRTIIYNNRS